MAIGDNLTKREQMLISIVVLALATAAVFWYFVYIPKTEALDELESHIETIEGQNRQARIDLTRGTTEELLTEAKMYEENLKLMRALVPTTNEVPALLEHVSTAARKVGLDLASVEPIPVIHGTDFDTYRYKIALLGGYHSIAQFLGNIGSLNRIVAPVGLELTLHQEQSSKPTAKSQNTLLSAKLHIQAYVVHAIPEEAPFINQ